MNKVILIGTVETDVFYKDDTIPLAKFDLITRDESRKDKNGEAMREWHKCVAFYKTAETVKGCVYKGREIALEGKIQRSSYEKDGVKHYSTDIVIDKITPLGRKELDNAMDKLIEEGRISLSTIGKKVLTEDDIPF